MKTWVLMYSLVWVAFLQILIILFPVLGLAPAIDLHLLVGAATLVLAYTVFVRVRGLACPERIKRITRTTAYLGVLQALLGLTLYVGLVLGTGVPFVGIIDFLHVVVAIAIITQASSSATAFDMWEENEFVTPPVAAPAPR